MGGRVIIYSLTDYLNLPTTPLKQFHFYVLKAGKILSLGGVCNFKTTKTQLGICLTIKRKADQTKCLIQKQCFRLKKIF